MSFFVRNHIVLLLLILGIVVSIHANGEMGQSSSVKDNVKVRIYLIRHGESASNKWGLIAGQDDVPLTKDGGVNEAKLLGQKSTIIQNVPSFLRVYSSDLSRARDTAFIALREAKTHQQDSIIEDKRLRERSYGHRQGFARSMNDDEIINIWKQYGIEPPLHETDEDLWERGKSWLLDVLQQVQTMEQLEEQFTTTATAQEGSKSATTTTEQPKVFHVLAASHSGLIREIILHLIPNEEYLIKKGAIYDSSKRKLIIPNTSVTILEFDIGKKEGAGDEASLSSSISSLLLQTVKLIELTNAKHLDAINAYDD